jgi:hypothetical protein
MIAYDGSSRLCSPHLNLQFPRIPETTPRATRARNRNAFPIGLPACTPCEECGGRDASVIPRPRGAPPRERPGAFAHGCQPATKHPPQQAELSPFPPSPKPPDTVSLSNNAPVRRGTTPPAPLARIGQRSASREVAAWSTPQRRPFRVASRLQTDSWGSRSTVATSQRTRPM